MSISDRARELELCALCGALPCDQTTPANSPEAELAGRFAAALLDKLKASEAKYGWDRAWMRADWADDLRAEIRRHVEKGDPIDVAAYAAFAFHHGYSLALSSPPVGEELDCYDAGLLGDGGGGNVEWWQDYIRSELASAHDFYQDQVSATPPHDRATIRREAFEEAAAYVEAQAKLAQDTVDLVSVQSSLPVCDPTFSCEGLRQIANQIRALKETPDGP